MQSLSNNSDAACDNSAFYTVMGLLQVSAHRHKANRPFGGPLSGDDSSGTQTIHSMQQLCGDAPDSDSDTSVNMFLGRSNV